MQRAPLHKRRHSGAKRVDVRQSLSVSETLETPIDLNADQIAKFWELEGVEPPKSLKTVSLVGHASLASRETRLTIELPAGVAMGHWQRLKEFGAKRLKHDGALWLLSVPKLPDWPMPRMRIVESTVPMVSASAGHECPVGRRVNTGSKPSRERRHDDRPNWNEVDRPEATTDPSTDAVERIPMPIGGIKERDRIAKFRE